MRWAARSGARSDGATAFFVAGVPGAVLALLLLWPHRAEARRHRPAGHGAVDSRLALGPSLRALWARRSYVYNTGAQVLYTFAMGGLATWMPTYYVRERGLDAGPGVDHVRDPPAHRGLSSAPCLAVGSRTGSLKKLGGAQFAVSGWGLVLALFFTLGAVLAPAAVVFWPCTFVTLFLLFLNIGPLNAAMANVLPSDLRARGFALSTMSIHLLGDAASPWLIGVASDYVGLTAPIIAAGVMLALAGLLLLKGRGALDRDVEDMAAADAGGEPSGAPSH